MPIAAVPGGGTPSYTFENHGYLLFYRNASYPAGAGLATLASIGGTKPATASRTTRALTQRPCICTECLDTMLRPQGISECVGRNSRYHFMIGNVFRTMIPGTNPRLEEIGARMRRHLPFGVRPYARSRIASRYGTQGNGYTLGNSTWPQASGRAGSRVLGLGRGGPGRPPALAQEGHRAKDLAGAGRDERGRRPPSHTGRLQPDPIPPRLQHPTDEGTKERAQRRRSVASGGAFSTGVELRSATARRPRKSKAVARVGP